MKHQQTPRQRRNDILPYLRRGQQGEIADKLHISPSTVSSVLNGRQNQDSDVAINVIRLAQEFTFRNNPFRRRSLEKIYYDNESK
ncbi:MAG: hypothetical protein RSB32_06185 [Mucinivorans sp.]